MTSFQLPYVLDAESILSICLWFITLGSVRKRFARSFLRSYKKFVRRPLKVCNKKFVRRSLEVDHQKFVRSKNFVRN